MFQGIERRTNAAYAFIRLSSSYTGGRNPAVRTSSIALKNTTGKY